jgi:hypothetical protein
MSVVPDRRLIGSGVGPHVGRRSGAGGLLIRSGDGDLFGQTAALSVGTDLMGIRVGAPPRIDGTAG